MSQQNGIIEKVKSMESWIWSAACSIRGAADAAKYKDYILPLIFVKRLCDVFDDEIDRIAQEVGGRVRAWELVNLDPSLVRFYLPLKPDNPETERSWSVIRKLSDKIGQGLTDILRSIAQENRDLQGIIDRVDFNATTHGQRDIDDGRLSNLIEKINEKSLGLKEVEPDIIGRSYEYLIRKFAEGSGKSAGEFYTPPAVGRIMAKVLDIEPGMEIYDPCCGSGGLLIKCELWLEEKMRLRSKERFAPLQLYGQEYTPGTWAMCQMNMVIHDMEGHIGIGDTLQNPRFKDNNRLKRFNRVVANPMWNQSKDSLSYINDDYFINDELERFPAGSCGGKIDWGWVQHIYSSLKDDGRAAIVLDTGAASRGSGSQGGNKEKECRKWFVDHDLIEGIIYLPENLFYNTTAPGIIIVLNRAPRNPGSVFMLHAGREFEKGDPKNFITDEGIERIAETYRAFREEEKFSRMVSREEIVKNDYNISPSRYVHVGDTETYRPLGEIVEELRELDEANATIDRELRILLEKLG